MSFLRQVGEYGVVYISAYDPEDRDFECYELFTSARDLGEYLLGWWLFSEMCELIPDGAPVRDKRGIENLLYDLQFIPEEDQKRIRKQYDYYRTELEKIY